MKVINERIARTTRERDGFVERLGGFDGQAVGVDHLCPATGDWGLGTGDSAVAEPRCVPQVARFTEQPQCRLGCVRTADRRWVSSSVSALLCPGGSKSSQRQRRLVGESHDGASGAVDRPETTASMLRVWPMGSISSGT
jgi:hypothetical protein